MTAHSINNEAWAEIRRLFHASFWSSLHFAIASSNDGIPHVTPIGSLILLPNETKGIYFEKFTSQLPRNLASYSRVCVLAVNSSRWLWLRALLSGRFTRPPAMRLHGEAGHRRLATAEELHAWHSQIRLLRKTRGYEKLWRDMLWVRELAFDAYEPVRLGAMTRTCNAHINAHTNTVEQCEKTLKRQI